MGALAEITVSDNLKSGITRACFHEPEVNRTYAELADHYGTAVLPARPYKPRDKAKVEAGVLLATRWIIAKLRNRTFFSLSELNDAIRGCLTTLNNRGSRYLGAALLARTTLDAPRTQLFETIERAALKPLPDEPFTFAAWAECRAGLDYHVEVGGHFYSVPSALVREKFWARITAGTVELFHRGNRVAAHVRGPADKAATTLAEHMPPAHRAYADWTPERVAREAAAVGPDTAALTAIIIERRPHPEQGVRASLGILRLVKRHGTARLEAACGRALAIGAHSYSSVKSILASNLDQQRPAATDGPAIAHDPNPWLWLLPLKGDFLC